MKASATIHDLPVELLAYILKYMVGTPDNPRVGGPAFFQASFLTRICKKWRDIVINTPAIWSTFNGSLTTCAISRGLERSKNAPLQLFLCYPVRFNPELQYAISRLYAQTNRIDILELCIDEQVWPSSLTRDLCKEAPLLERICMHRFIPTLRPVVVPSTLFGGVRPPKLRHLSLRFCQVLWDSPWLRDLQVLEIELGAAQERVDFPQLLDVLRAMESLEVLTLSGCLPINVPSEILDDVVTLSRLRKLTLLSAEADTCAAFLHFVDCAPSLLRIRAEASPSKLQPFFEACAQRLRLNCVNTLKIDGKYRQGTSIQLQGSYATDVERPHCVFDIHVTMGPREPPLLIVSLGTDLLPVADVHTLHLYTNTASLDESCMSSLSKNLPNLRALDVSHNADLDAWIAFVLADVPFAKLEKVQQPALWMPDPKVVLDLQKAIGQEVVFVERGLDAGPPRDYDNRWAMDW